MDTLNKASLDVWNEHQRDEKRFNISERILLLDSYHVLTEAEQKELQSLLKLEKKLLSESESLTETNKKSLRKINSYKSILEKDDRLSTLFYERINLFLNDGKTLTEEDITKIYIQLREEDIDLEGHSKLNQHYETLVAIEDIELEEDDKCKNPNCIYCKDVSDEEYSQAFDSLKKSGYFNPDLKEEDKLMELMVTINRLEAELLTYKDIDCQYPEDGEPDTE